MDAIRLKNKKSMSGINLCSHLHPGLAADYFSSLLVRHWVLSLGESYAIGSAYEVRERECKIHIVLNVAVKANANEKAVGGREDLFQT